MSWQGVFARDEIAAQFARADCRGRLGGSFLFVGPQGVGKRVFAFAPRQDPPSLPSAIRSERKATSERNVPDASSEELLKGVPLLRRMRELQGIQARRHEPQRRCPDASGLPLCL